MVHGGNLLRSDNCGFATYECRTVYDVELADNQWKRAEQSMACRTRENQLLMKQRDEVRERIKRLEESGDMLSVAAAFIGWHIEIEKWRKAKEAKP
jgi:DNA-binding transcriptional MerR regulator